MLSRLFRQKHMSLVTALVVGSIFIHSGLSNTSAKAASDATVNIDEISSQLLNNPSFIDQLQKKLTSSQNDDHIKQVVKDYLVKNPEIMIEVQEALNQKQEAKAAETQSSVIETMAKEIFNSPDDAIIGNPKGSVTMVEFFDYNCGYCKQSYPDTQAMLKKYPDLRIVLKDFPILGPDSVKAHIVARAFQKLSPEKYSMFHKALLTSQGRANEAKAIKVALELGADEKKLRTEMEKPELQEPFVNNGQIAYALGINGTPSYIIGKDVLVGAVGEDVLENKIQAQQKSQ